MAEFEGVVETDIQQHGARVTEVGKELLAVIGTTVDSDWFMGKITALIDAMGDYLAAVHQQLTAQEAALDAERERSAALEATLKHYRSARALLGECWSALAYFERSGRLPTELYALLTDLEAWNKADATLSAGTGEETE